MFETRQIVFEISTRLYERMEERAAEQHRDLSEWVLRAAIRALYPPEFTLDRLGLEAAWDARPRPPAPRPAPSPAAQPATERKPNAPHT